MTEKVLEQGLKQLLRSCTGQIERMVYQLIMIIVNWEEVQASVYVDVGTQESPV